MSASRGNYIALDGAAGGAVRQDDAISGRAARRSGTGSSWSGSRPRATRWRRSSRSRAFIVARSHGDGGGAARRRSTSRASCASDRRRRRSRRRGSPTAIRSTCRRCSSSCFGVGSTSEARRLIAQGGVKVDGEAVTELDVPRARLGGALVQAGKRRFMRLPRRLTPALSVAIMPRLPERAA